MGVGSEPWLKQGPLSTCTACQGTGKTGEQPASDAPSDADTAQTAQTEEAPVDNQTDEKPRGFLSRMLG